MIQANVINILNNITDICQRLGRDPRAVTVIAATKYADAPQLREILSAGIIHIGENRIQPAQQKFSVLDESDVNITRHFIGHLQRNKVKKAVDLFDCIQSVDTLALAQDIDQAAAAKNKILSVLIQVNISHEEQKSGIEEEEVIPFLDRLSGLKNIRLEGLMGMAPFVDDQAVIRDCFRRLKALFDNAADHFKGHATVNIKHLSMGMTDDYEIALEEGSNMLRIGRAFFQ